MKAYKAREYHLENMDYMFHMPPSEYESLFLA